jgi:hypothetical protein
MKKRIYGVLLLISVMVSSIHAETQTLYSWTSTAGVVTQTGGTITQHGSAVNRINVECSGYYVIALLGKRENINDGTSTANATYMELTLADGETFHAGDRITITAMRNTTETNANATLYMLYGNGTEVIDNNVWNNLGQLKETTIGGGASAKAAMLTPNESSMEELQYISMFPNTNVFTVPEEADGSTTLRLTRNVSECRLYVVALKVERDDTPDAVETVSENVGNTLPQKYIGCDGRLYIGKYDAAGRQIR